MRPSGRQRIERGFAAGELAFALPRGISGERISPAAAGEKAKGNLASNRFGKSDLRNGCLPVRGALKPFKCGFSPFSPHRFGLCDRPSSLMLKEYRLTHRGILDWYRCSRNVVG